MKQDKSIPRILPPVYLLAAMVVMIVLGIITPIGYWLEFLWRYVGILFLLIGFLVIALSRKLFHRLGTPVPPGVQATVLVTKGIFQYTRNPMYLGGMVVLAGVAILLGSISPLIVIPFFVWIIQRKFILQEEKWMESWFGQSYLEYKKKTPRWL